jgi:hypothetical protein
MWRHFPDPKTLSYEAVKVRWISMEFQKKPDVETPGLKHI